MTNDTDADDATEVLPWSVTRRFSAEAIHDGPPGGSNRTAIGSHAASSVSGTIR